MRAARSVNLQKNIKSRASAAFVRVPRVAQKTISSTKTLQIEPVDGHPMDAAALRRRRKRGHLAKLQLTHAKISFTEIFACTSLEG
jgi:hypothetical protein